MLWLSPRVFSALHKGQVILHKNRYLEILSTLHIQRGEGQGTHLEFIDLQSFNRGKLHAKKGQDFTPVDLSHTEVEFVSTDASAVHVVDRKYQPLEIPLTLAPWARSLSRGARMQLVMAGGDFVRLSPPADLKFVKRSIILHEGKYFDVLSNESKHVARQAGFVKMEASEVVTGKKEFMQFSANGKVHKVEITKEPTQVQYVDKTAGVVVVSDAEFNTIEIPLTFFKDVLPFLEPGSLVTVNRDSEQGVIVKCQFSGPILQKARAAKK